MANPQDYQSTLYPNGIGLKNHYEFHPGVCVLPVADEPPATLNGSTDWSPVVVLRLHAPYRLRSLKYEVPRKQNNPPVLPTPGDTGAFVFVGGAVSMVAVNNQGFASFDWIAECSYTYVEDCVSRPQDGLVLGKPPFESGIDASNRGLSSNTPSLQVYAGAVANAGVQAVCGSNSLTSQGLESSIGWQYSNQSYFPGCLFNDDIANGGPPVVPFSSRN